MTLLLVLPIFGLPSNLHKGEKIHYSLSLLNFELVDWDIEIIKQLDNQKYLIEHNFTLPILKDKRINQKVNKQLLNTNIKSQITLRSCQVMGGVITKITIGNKNIKTCKLDIKRAPKKILKSLRKLRLYKKQKSNGSIYFAKVPYLGIAKIESNIANLEIIDYSW